MPIATSNPFDMNPELTVELEYSSDDQNWVATAGTPETSEMHMNAGATGRGTHARTSPGPTPVSLSFVRLAIKLGAT